MAGSRLLLADDHPLVRMGLAQAAKVALPRLIVDHAGSVAEAEKLVARHDGYRMAVLDLVLPDARGFSGFLRLQQVLGKVPIVLIAANQQPELVEAARALGAAGFVSKSQPVDELLKSLRGAFAGQPVFPRTLTAAIAGNDDAALARQRLADLSGAQLRVLTALAGGRLNKQIAADLGIAEATIKAHMTAIFRKLGVTNRSQAILAAQPLLGEVTEEEMR